MVFVLHCDNPNCRKPGLLPVAVELEANDEHNLEVDGVQTIRYYKYVKRLLFHSLECLDAWRAAIGEGTL